MEPGKLFIGGTSWDTNEEKLKEYFQTYGEVVEAVIMKDRATGRARGFGFVIYADPAVADRVVRQKHMIDGRTVEAKKAVPRDDQHILNRNSSSPVASPVLARTKKIFVGGLASTVTEADFKRYFSQFGNITDVVVMYDHNTQRPRGFGFITYDSEEAVERALIKSFHELNGKMVEVKPAVPKELSPGPSRSPLGGGSSGFNRVNGLLNSFPHLFNPGPIGGHGMKFDERHAPIPLARSGFLSSSPSSYGSGLNYEPRISPSCNETVNMLLPKSNFEQGLNALNSSYVARHGHLFDYEEGYSGTSSNLGSSSWSLWGNGNIGGNTVAGNGAHLSFRGGNIEQDAIKNTEAIWGSSPLSVQSAARSLSNGPSLSYGREALNLGSMTGFYGGDIGARAPLASSSASLGGGLDSKFDDFYTGGGGQSWPSESLGLKGSGSFDFGLGNVVSDASLNNPARLCW